MTRFEVFSDHLSRGTLAAAGAPTVAKAVRELALHALTSQGLTAGNMAAVVHSLGEGVEGCEPPAWVPLHDVQREAWAGLSDAFCQALRAIELAAIDLREWGTRMSAEENRRLLLEFESMERAIAGGRAAERLDATCRERLAAIISLLRRQEEAPVPGRGLHARTRRDAKSLAMIATAILIGLTTEARGARSH